MKKVVLCVVCFVLMCSCAFAGTNSYAETFNLFQEVVSADQVITAESDPYIPQQTIPGTAVGKSYECQLKATGTTPMKWTLYAGSLPDGLSLSEGGKISGRAQKTGTYPFYVKVENSVGYTIGYGAITVVAASYGSSSGGSGGGCNAGLGAAGFVFCAAFIIKKINKNKR